MALVTYAQAKDQLGITDDDSQARIELVVVHASQLVLDALVGASPVDVDPELWDESTDPASDRNFALAQAACLLLIGELWRFRGDDEDDKKIDDATLGHLNQRAAHIIRRLRVPTLA